MFKPMFRAARKVVCSLVLIAQATSLFASGGTGGGGTGGGGGGGTVTGACSTISSYSVSSNRSKYGYPWSEVNGTYVLKSCSADFVLSGTITATDIDTGVVLGVVPITGWTGVGTIRANDGTNVRVDINVVNYATGAVVDTRSGTTTTPAPRVKTT